LKGNKNPRIVRQILIALNVSDFLGIITDFLGQGIMTISNVVAIGECMLELASLGSEQMQLGFAGDSYNVAVYLARNGIKTRYLTAIGDDPYSDQMLARFRTEGIDTSAVHRIANSLPGLYLIQNSADGEREFFYYRSEAAVRQLFNKVPTAKLAEQLADAKVIYFSGISLAIFDQRSRAILFDLLSAAKQAGARLVFDTNYRSRLWPDSATCRAVINHFLTLVDIALVTDCDEQALYNDLCAETTLQRLSQQVSEVVVKRGPEACLVLHQGQRHTIELAPVERLVDTTGAGDAFNAAYLAARLKGQPVDKAVLFGHQLASQVIQHKGAIIQTNRLEAEPTVI